MKRLTERERLTRKYGEHYVCNAEPEVCDLQKKNPKDDDCCCDCAIQERMIDKLGAYENIGTLEECRAAVERMKPKKPIIKYGCTYLCPPDCGGKEFDEYGDVYHCPNCNGKIRDKLYDFCLNCGQALDWNESEKGISAKAVKKVKELADGGGWIPCSERLPEPEEEVIIHARRKFRNGDTHDIIAMAMYEDGTMREIDSVWNWQDIDGEWDEEEDCYIIPEGWWENCHYRRDEDYNNPVDDKVIAWRPLPEPYKED